MRGSNTVVQATDSQPPLYNQQLDGPSGTLTLPSKQGLPSKRTAYEMESSSILATTANRKKGVPKVTSDIQHVERQRLLTDHLLYASSSIIYVSVNSFTGRG